jgi:ribosomal protein L11 methyltransferase
VNDGFVSLCFDASADDAERWSDALLEAGALSIDVSDPGAGTPDEVAIFDEPGTDGPRVWQTSRVQAIFAKDANIAEVAQQVAAAMGEPLPAHRVDHIGDADWVRLTQSQFTPIRIDERLWIVPTWCSPVDPSAINLTLDPGLAFGTGSHPTTRLCLQWLSTELVPGETVLDYGCGSGVLAIAAKKLGASSVWGVDIDPQAIVASRANAALNGVAVHFAEHDSTLAPVDVLVANILASPLQVMAPLFAGRVRAGGRIVLSGILVEQRSMLRAAYAPWFMIDEWGCEDGWVALAGTRLAE